MGKKSKKGNKIVTNGLLLFIYRNRIPLITITLAAIIVSVIVSLLITERYRSSVILYPTASGSLSRSVMNPADNLAGFGQESDAERLLQILQSDAIREMIVEKYSLMEHYSIKESSRYPYTELVRKFDKNITFRKTEYMAIAIEVLDTDPGIAAGMANDIAEYIDSVMNDMLQERARQSLAIVRDEYLSLRQEVQEMEDSLRKIRGMGIVDYESQAEVFNNAYALAVLNKDTASIDIFSKRINTLTSWGGVYVRLRDNLELQNRRLGDLKSVYDEVRLNAEKTIPHKFIVTQARVAEKKSYPVRSVIVIVSAVSAFLLTLFMLVLLEAFRKELVSRPPGKTKKMPGKAKLS